ncbi:phosphate-starvation-inducible protein PsiE [Planomicrobium sp. CPCC 101110]|uniref:phosphate-starvation-inducible protein PsiE n=1 Tax=Planomicrobium sp. CPCC 101110 TaxID=2599619 RepID=UPI0011B72471|nr:phosphate-starvation-inducible protein PsiE [Planomicrobium sp. CPCC 101110]TWT25944.1 phosphate-starvation-inducible protein PsiE [Planomicrobium sp. CPCC 101110]
MAARIPGILQVVLNSSLIVLGAFLAYQLAKELIVFGQLVLKGGTEDYQAFFARILIFFLYFEFISMIVKYFKEHYHFPLRYFIYIGIAAMVRLIIVEHDDAKASLYNSMVILVLIAGYFIMNITPGERLESPFSFRRRGAEDA